MDVCVQMASAHWPPSLNEILSCMTNFVILYKTKIIRVKYIRDNFWLRFSHKAFDLTLRYAVLIGYENSSELRQNNSKFPDLTSRQG